jgi:catalase
MQRRLLLPMALENPPILESRCNACPVQVLNQNPDNFFNENEMLAFCPGVIVPGIGYSDDKLLQTRIFSYADTQRHRLGPNYLQLPINAPKCPFHNNHYDGSGNMCQRNDEVNYFPSRNNPTAHAQPHPISQAHISGKREKVMIAKENNFVQVLCCSCWGAGGFCCPWPHRT